LSPADAKFLRESALEDKIADTIVTNAEVSSWHVGRKWLLFWFITAQENRSRMVYICFNLNLVGYLVVSKTVVASE